MKLLALESATSACSAALWSDGAVLLRRAPEPLRNSEAMLPMVRELLAQAGWTVGTLDAVAFGAGPGAFTGLRVACGIAQGLAFGADLPVLPVGTLDTLAESLRGDPPACGQRRVLAALDARMGECYWATLCEDGTDWQCLAGPALAAPDSVPLPAGEDWLGVGDGFDLAAGALGARCGQRLRLAPGFARLPDAAWLVRLAAVRVGKGLARPAEEAAPLYVRDKVAYTRAERSSGA